MENKKNITIEYEKEEKTIEEYIYYSICKFPLYPRQFMFAVTNSDSKLEKLTGTSIDDSLAFVECINYKGKMTILMVINMEDQVDIQPGLISHEAYHVISRVMAHIGMEHDVENQEPAAYFLEWVVNKVYSELDKFEKKGLVWKKV